MGWFNENRSSRVGDQFGDLFSADGQSPQYESDRFTRNSFQVPRISASDYNIGPQDDSGGLDDYMKYLNRPKPSMDAYRAALNEAPQAEDYRPSWATRIAAGLGGISAGMKNAGEGIKVASATNRMPFANALADYKAHVDPLESAAKLESDDSDATLKYMYQAHQLKQAHENNERQRQNDLMDYRVAAGGLEENRRWHDATIGQGNKRLSQEASNYLSLDNYRRNQNKIGSYNANTQRQGMLNSNKNAVDANGIRLYDVMHPPQHYTAPPTAGGISTASQDVMAEMHQTHPGFITTDDAGKYVITAPPDVTSPEYTIWKANRDEMNSRINRRARGSVDFGGGGGDNRYDVTPAGEEEQ